LRGVADATKADTDKLVLEIGDCTKKGDQKSVCGRLEDLKSDVADVREIGMETKQCVVKVDDKIGDCGKDSTVCSKLHRLEEKSDQTQKTLGDIEDQITSETNQIDACLTDIKERIGSCGEMPICARLTMVKDSVNVNTGKLDMLKDQVKGETDQIDQCLEKLKCDVDKVQETADRIEDDLECGDVGLCGRLQQIDSAVTSGFAETDAGITKVHKSLDEVNDKLGDCPDVTVCGELTKLLAEVDKVKECVIHEDDDIEEAVKTLQTCVTQLKEALNCDGGTLCQCLMTIKSFLTQQVGECYGTTLCARVMALKTTNEQINNTLGMCEGTPVCDRLKSLDSKVDMAKAGIAETTTAVTNSEANVCAKIKDLSAKVDTETDQIDACLEEIKCDNLGKPLNGTVHAKLDMLKSTTASIDGKLTCGDRDLCGVLSDLSEQVSQDSASARDAVKACITNSETALSDQLDGIDTKLGPFDGSSVSQALGNLQTKVDDVQTTLDDCDGSSFCERLKEIGAAVDDVAVQTTLLQVDSKVDALSTTLGDCGTESVCVRLGSLGEQVGDVRDALFCDPDETPLCVRITSLEDAVGSVDAALKCGENDTPICEVLSSIGTNVSTVETCVDDIKCKILGDCGTEPICVRLGDLQDGVTELKDLLTCGEDPICSVLSNLSADFGAVNGNVTNVGQAVDDNTALLNMIKQLLTETIEPTIDGICNKIDKLEEKVDALCDKIKAGEGVLKDINVSVGDIQLTLSAEGGAGGAGGTAEGGSGTGGVSSSTASTGSIDNDSSADTGDVNNENEAETGAVSNDADAATGDVDNTSDASSGDIDNTSDASSGDIDNTSDASGDTANDLSSTANMDDTNSNSDTSGDTNTTIDTADTQTLDNQDDFSTSGISDDDSVNSVVDATEASNTGSNGADVIESSNDPENNVQSTATGETTTTNNSTSTSSDQATDADVTNSNQASEVGGENVTTQEDSSSEQNTTTTSQGNGDSAADSTNTTTANTSADNSGDNAAPADDTGDNTSTTDTVDNTGDNSTTTDTVDNTGDNSTTTDTADNTGGDTSTDAPTDTEPAT